MLAGHLEQAQRRLERLKRVKKELFDALTGLQERLSSAGIEQCPCAIAEAAGAPRIVKVLARQQGCCEHGRSTGWPPPPRPRGAARPARARGRADPSAGAESRTELP